MKCVETYASHETASEMRQMLTKIGIEARIAVDPLADRTPALGSFDGVAIMVKEGDVLRALGILRGAKMARAS